MAKNKKRKPPVAEHNVVAPSVRKMADATRKTKKTRPAEDFNQIAARIRRTTEGK